MQDSLNSWFAEILKGTSVVHLMESWIPEALVLTAKDWKMEGAPSVRDSEEGDRFS